MSSASLERSATPPATRQRHDAVALALLAMLCLVILLPALIATGVPQHGDMSFPYSLANWIDRFLPLWNPRSETSNLQSIDRFWSTVPLLLAERWLGVSMSLSVRIAYVGETLAAAFSGYAFCRAFIRQTLSLPASAPYIAAASGLMFAFSPWALSQVQAPWFYLAYGLTPTLLLLFDAALTLGYLRHKFAAAFIFSIIASTPQFAGFSMLALAWWLAVRSFMTPVPGLSRRTLWSRAVQCAALAGGLNAYWIIPGLILEAQGYITPGYFIGLQTLHQLSQNSGLLHVLGGSNSWITWYRPPLVGRAAYERLELVAPACAALGVVLLWGHRFKSPILAWMLGAAFFSILVSTAPSLPVLNTFFYSAVLHLPLG